MNKYPYIPLYTGSYKSATMTLTMEESGCYMQILMTMWEYEGSLPLDLHVLGSICRMSKTRFSKVWVSLQVFFIEKEGRIFSEKLTKELEKNKEISQKNSEKARKKQEISQKNSENIQAKPLINNDSNNAAALPIEENRIDNKKIYKKINSETYFSDEPFKEQATTASPSLSFESKKVKKLNSLKIDSPEILEAYKKIIEVYPKRLNPHSKQNDLKALVEVFKCGANIDEIITAIKSYKFGSDPQYVKMISSWLRLRVWEGQNLFNENAEESSPKIDHFRQNAIIRREKWNNDFTWDKSWGWQPDELPFQGNSYFDKNEYRKKTETMLELEQRLNKRKVA